MNVQLILEDINGDYKEINNIENVSDRHHFFYDDANDGKCEVSIFADEIIIKRTAKSHSTVLAFNENSYAEIKTIEGSINFSIKVIAINKNNDIISIVYCINDENKKITIKYLGV